MLRLIDYTSFEVTTSYRKVDYPRAKAIFPNIAICNKNHFFWNTDAMLNSFEVERNKILREFNLTAKYEDPKPKRPWPPGRQRGDQNSAKGPPKSRRLFI